jgi:hypothetical protein
MAPRSVVFDAILVAAAHNAELRRTDQEDAGRASHEHPKTITSEDRSEERVPEGERE